jgi:hypothetical protein
MWHLVFSKHMMQFFMLRVLCFNLELYVGQASKVHSHVQYSKLWYYPAMDFILLKKSNLNMYKKYVQDLCSSYLFSRIY